MAMEILLMYLLNHGAMGLRNKKSKYDVRANKI